MISVALFFIALLLTFLMAVPALLHTIVGAIRWKGKGEYVKAAFFRGAHAIDVFGNVAYATFLNDWFIRKGGYHYGAKGETISSATGKNWVNGRLTWLGLGLCGLLNWIDPDHCWKYIEGRTVGMQQPAPVKWPYIALFLLVAGVILAGTTWFWWWILF